MSDRTIIVGRKVNKPDNWDSLDISERKKHPYAADVQVFSRPGHLGRSSILALIKKYGFVGVVKIEHFSTHCCNCPGTTVSEFEIQI